MELSCASARIHLEMRYYRRWCGRTAVTSRSIPLTDENALLAAIIAHPSEDTPRLVFADWLDEHDQPERAAFIRDHIAHARTNTSIPKRSIISPEGARREIVCPWYLEPWVKEFGTTVERGFVNTVTGGVCDWLRHADAILASQPIERVCITGNAGGVSCAWEDGNMISSTMGGGHQGWHGRPHSNDFCTRPFAPCHRLRGRGCRSTLPRSCSHVGISTLQV